MSEGIERRELEKHWAWVVADKLTKQEREHLHRLFEEARPDVRESQMSHDCAICAEGVVWLNRESAHPGDSSGEAK